MKITAYVIDGHDLEIRPAPVERAWMLEHLERLVPEFQQP